MNDDIVDKLRSQIGDDIQKIYDHESLFKLAITEIEDLRKFRDACFMIHSNIDLDIKGLYP